MSNGKLVFMDRPMRVETSIEQKWRYGYIGVPEVDILAKLQLRTCSQWVCRRFRPNNLHARIKGDVCLLGMDRIALDKQFCGQPSRELGLVLVCKQLLVVAGFALAQEIVALFPTNADGLEGVFVLLHVLEGEGGHESVYLGGGDVDFTIPDDLINLDQMQVQKE